MQAHRLADCRRSGLSTLVDEPTVTVEALATRLHLLPKSGFDFADAAYETLLRGPQVERPDLAGFVVEYDLNVASEISVIATAEEDFVADEELFVGSQADVALGGRAVLALDRSGDEEGLVGGVAVEAKAELALGGVDAALDDLGVVDGSTPDRSTS